MLVTWGPRRLVKLLSMNQANVRFLESPKRILSVLEIQTPLSVPAMRGRLAHLLFDLRIQLVRHEEADMGRRRVERLWLVEFDGAPIVARRRLEVQAAVLAAVDLLTRRPRNVRALRRHSLDADPPLPAA